MQLYSKNNSEFDFFKAKENVMKRLQRIKSLRLGRDKENEKSYNIKISNFNKKKSLKRENSNFRLLKKKRGSSNRSSYIIKNNGSRESFKRKKSNGKLKFGEVITFLPENISKSKDKLFRGSNYKKFKILNTEPTPLLVKNKTKKKGFIVFKTPNLPQKWKRSPVSRESLLKMKSKKKGRILRFN